MTTSWKRWPTLSANNKLLPGTMYHASQCRQHLPSAQPSFDDPYHLSPPKVMWSGSWLSCDPHGLVARGYLTILLITTWRQMSRASALFLQRTHSLERNICRFLISSIINLSVWSLELALRAMDVQVTRIWRYCDHLRSVTPCFRDAVSIRSQKIKEIRSVVVPANAACSEWSTSVHDKLNHDPNKICACALCILASLKAFVAASAAVF